MNKSKTLKFSLDEDHKSFEKTKVEQTKVIDLESLNIDNKENLDLLTTEQLEYRLEFEEKDSKIIAEIKKILISRNK